MALVHIHTYMHACMHACMHTCTHACTRIITYKEGRRTDERTDGCQQAERQRGRKTCMLACMYACVRFCCVSLCVRMHGQHVIMISVAISGSLLCATAKLLGKLASVVSTAGYTTLRSTKLRTACAKLLSICRFTGQVWSPPRRRSLGSPLRCPRLLTGRRGFRDSK